MPQPSGGRAAIYVRQAGFEKSYNIANASIEGKTPLLKRKLGRTASINIHVINTNTAPPKAQTVTASSSTQTNPKKMVDEACVSYIIIFKMAALKFWRN